MSREWPRTNAKFYLLRSALFVTRVITRYMEKAGLETEIISRNISEVASKLWGNPAYDSLILVGQGRRFEHDSTGCAGV